MLPSLVQRISLTALLVIIKHVEFAIFIWNLLITSSWSRPSKVRQHVALSPDPFFAHARSGSGNETNWFHFVCVMSARENNDNEPPSLMLFSRKTDEKLVFNKCWPNYDRHSFCAGLPMRDYAAPSGLLDAVRQSLTITMHVELQRDQKSAVITWIIYTNTTTHTEYHDHMDEN